jgi:adenine nucleotide transporter 17
MHVVDVLKKEGFLRLYNGMSSALVGIIISSGIYFFSYRLSNNLILENNLSTNIVLDTLITSFLAGSCTALTSNPIWVLNTRMAQVDNTNIE